MEPPDDDDDDFDLTLRHVAHRFPEALARALLPEARTITRGTWIDTQLAMRERRLDKTLLVEADGETHAEHVEWALRWSRELPRRMFEYHALKTLALGDATPPKLPPPRLRSTVVLLSGRAKPWPREGRFRTAPRGERFSGLRFRIEAVYQRTVAELAARRSPLWMIFAPLALDATPDAMGAVIARLRDENPPETFEELAIAMSVLAGARRRDDGLRAAIESHLPRELVMRNWIYTEGFEKGVARGIEQGIEQGIEKGVEKGRSLGEAHALRETIALALTTRGLSVDEALRARLEGESQTAVLRRWVTRAMTARHPHEIFDAD